MTSQGRGFLRRGRRFLRRAWRRGYHVDAVDALIDRVEATLAGVPISDPVTPDELHRVGFRRRFGGYDRRQVDQYLSWAARMLAGVRPPTFGQGYSGPSGAPVSPEPMGRVSPPAGAGPRYGGGHGYAGAPVPSMPAPSVPAPPMSAPPVRDQGSAGAGMVTSRRWLNVLVTDLTGYDIRGPLAVDTDHLLRVAIGRRAPGSVIAPTQPFPDQQLPRTRDGWCLDVVVTSDRATVDARAHELTLPMTGDSWICECGWRAATHTCAPATRRGWLDIPFRSPATPGHASIEIRIYYGSALLQVAAVTVAAGTGAGEASAPYGVLTACRDPELGNLRHHAGRSLSCHLHGRDDGRHLIAINNGHGYPMCFEFTDDQTAQAAAALRRVLYDTHLESDHQTPRHQSGRSGEPIKTPHEFAADVRRLAGAGAKVYRAMMVDSNHEHQLQRWLAEATGAGRPAVIQIARSANTRLSLPWQLIYDEPLVDGARDAALCQSVRHWGPGAGVLVEPPPPRCPYSDQHDRSRGTVCLFGFWGLAHVIETPPTTYTRLLPRLTSSEGPPQLVAAVNHSLHRWSEHLDRVATLAGRPVVPAASTWPQLRTSAAEGSDVLYFYCHGAYDMVDGIPPRQPFLDLGAGNRITSDRLSAWSATVRWDRRQPLVVLNGCGTGEFLPDLLSTFVDAFVNSLHAAGVLTTEIAVESQAAQYAAEALLRLLWRGYRTGEAIRMMRWLLLSRGSVFGLAYTPYCDAFLGLPAAVPAN